MYSRNLADFERLVMERERSLGDDPALADDFGKLSQIYFVFGRFADAERLLWRAVTIYGKHFGNESMSVTPTLLDLGYLYETQGWWPQAEEVYRLAYAVKLKNLGPTHLETLQAARCLACVSRAQGKNLTELELERITQIQKVAQSA